MQIHEYKDKYKHNTQIQFRWKLSKVCYSFGMIMVQGSQKLICWVSDMQIDNTNTLIQIQNTFLVDFAYRPSICNIFGMVMGFGLQ